MCPIHPTNMAIFSFIFILSAFGKCTANIYAATSNGLGIFDERGSWSFQASNVYKLAPVDHVFSNGSHIFASGTQFLKPTNGGTVSISEDNGKTWVTSQVLSHLPHSAMGNNYGVIPFLDNIYTSIGLCWDTCGMFVSKGNGSWEKVHQLDQSDGFYICNSTMYATNFSILDPEYFHRSIVQSVDGDHWYPVTWNTSTATLPILITDGGYIYAYNEIWNHASHGMGYDGLGLGISKDNGTTWDYKDRSELINCTSCDMSKFSVSSVAKKRNYVFVSTSLGLAISEDNGETWTTQLAGQSVTNVMTTHHRLYAGLNDQHPNSPGLVVSDDWGSTWTDAGLSAINVGQTIFTDFQTCGVLYGLNSQWIAMSQDHGLTWKKTKCGDIDLDLRLDSIHFTRSEIYASYAGGGLYVSEDGGQTWISKSHLVNQFAPFISFESGPIAWITGFSVHNDHLCFTGYTTLACSDDAGTTMKQFKSGRFLSVFVTDQTICAVSDTSTVLSNDFGKTWISSPLPVQKYFLHDTVFADGKIYFLNLDFLNDSFGFGYEVQLYRSHDWGATWNMFRITTRRFPGKTITIDPNDSSSIEYWGKYKFIAQLDPRLLYGYVEKAGEFEISDLYWKSDEYDPSYHIVGLSIYVNNGTIYVGIPIGELYISQDDGEHWSLMEVFENKDITSIYVSDVLYVVTKQADQDRLYEMFISYDDGQTWKNASNNQFSLDNTFESGPISAIMECSKYDKNGTSHNPDPKRPSGFTEWYLVLIACISFFIITAVLICGYRFLVIRERMKRTQRIDGAQLVLVKKLGNGQFGEVWLAKYKSNQRKKIPIWLARGKSDQTKEMEVALKLSKHHQNGQSDLNLIQADCFYQETIALNVLRHDNIISIIGSCTNLKDQHGRSTSALVLEYMNGGSATDYMSKEQKNLKEQDMMKILLDICQAGKHLSKMGVLHRDIGARNVLIRKIESTGRPIIAKLTDFGLAKDMGKLSKYYKTTNPDRTLFHMRYTAPEGFRGQFSPKSDVWSFGVFMWELYMMKGDGTEYQDGGPVPFAHIPSQVGILQELKNGGRLQCPPAASTEIYAIMEQCWSFEPEPRPTFQELINHFRTKRDQPHPTTDSEPDMSHPTGQPYPNSAQPYPTGDQANQNIDQPFPASNPEAEMKVFPPTGDYMYGYELMNVEEGKRRMCNPYGSPMLGDLHIN